MTQFDERVDAYIQKSEDFAKPILEHLRNLIHSSFPEISETIKWGMPFFEFKGTVCHFASFKHHCAFGFWKGALLNDPNNILDKKASMGQFGRITCFADLPNDEVLIGFLHEAIQLNEKNISAPKSVKVKKQIPMPQDFMEMLKADISAMNYFDKISSSQKQAYLNWIAEAKTETTRTKRVNTSIKWLGEGKNLMWKYERK